MTGLEKIIEHIRQESVEESEKIIANAKAQVEEIEANSKEECAQLAKQLEEANQSEIDLSKHRGESYAALAKRKLLLNAKQKMIEDVLNDTKTHLLGLPSAEYFDILIKMIKKYSHDYAGELILGASDLNRLPAGFDDSIKKFNLTLSKATRNINGGFVLLYGDIEENCSFDAILEANKEELQDKIGNLLFGQA